MNQTKYLISLSLAAALLLGQTGCALVTTRRVAMAAGKAIGKKVYEKNKEDKARSEGAESQ